MVKVLDKLNLRMAYRKDMIPLLEFFQKSYPTLGWTKEFMKWQYFDNPAGEAKIWVCYDGKRLIGSVTALPHLVWVRNRKVIGYRIQDVLTDPDYRGQSIYRRLSMACYSFLDSEEEGVHFTFPNEKSDRVFREAGWSSVGEIPLWAVRPIKYRKKGIQPQESHLLETFSIAEENVWTYYRSAGFLGIDKNASFLNWKYINNPRARYQCYKVDQAQSSIVVVLKKFHDATGNILLHLCDLFYSRFEADELINVLSFTHERAAAEKASVITTWIAPNNELASLMSSVGFKYSPVVSRSYFLRSSNARAHSFFPCWNIRMGDSDVY